MTEHETDFELNNDFAGFKQKISTIYPKLYLGTCSWKYDSWKNVLYSNNVMNHLEEYSQYFNSVEIDQWFWSLHGADKVSLPDIKTAREYAASVSGDFKFSVKVPNSITLTHFYNRNKNEPLVENPHFLSNDLFSRFLENISPLADRLGPIMFQFEYLNKQKMVSQQHFLQQFALFIEKCPSELQYGVEIRNPNYLNVSYFEFLKEFNLTHVFLQGYYMPSIFPVLKSFSHLLKDCVVIRLHGPDRKGIESESRGVWNRILQSKDTEIHELTSILISLFKKQHEIYINVNNHYEGSAPLTAKRILDGLE